MNCRRISSLLSAYIDGELSGVEMLAVREHLSNCITCREDYESLRDTKQKLARMTAVPPRDDLAGKICARLDVVEAPVYRRLWVGFSDGFRSRLSPAFATVAVVTLAFLLLGAKGRTPHSYDVARVWQQFPKPVAVSFTDLARNDFGETRTSFLPLWESGSPRAVSQPSVALVGLTR